MRMKKILIFGLLLFTSVLLVACNGKKGEAVISGPTDSIIRTGSSFNPLDKISASDAGKGDVTNKIVVEGQVDTTKAGTYTLTYKVKASDGSEATLVRKVEVKDVVLNGLGNRKVGLGGEGATFDPESGVSVNDPIRGTLRASTPEHKKHFEITGEVDRTVEGDYEIVYLITIDDYVKEVIRVISVVNEPMLNVPDSDEDFMLEFGSHFDAMSGVTASRTVTEERPVMDEETGEQKVDEEGELVFEYVVVSKSIKEHVVVDGSVDVNKTGTYVLTYKIQDPENPLEFLKNSAGDVIEVVKRVKVYIKVEIRGIAPAQVTLGDEFDDLAGITGYDTIEGNVTADIQVVGTVNVNRLGNYTLTYILTGSEGVTTTVTRNVSVVPPIEGQQEIIIMAGDVREVDPFLSDYSGTRQREKQDIQLAVQEEFNVKVTYKLYPDNAAWGQDRINALIQATTAGTPLADIFYHVTTDWLGALAYGGAIKPINDYLGDNSNIDQQFIDAGYYAGNNYAFSSGALNLQSGLYFNVDLLGELGISDPAQMYLEGNWKWTDFKTWAVEAQSLLATKGEDYFALGGALAYYAENLVPLNGGRYLDMVNGEVVFNSPEAMEAYDFIHELFNENVFESGRTYDQGSPEWQGGKVLMHPGDLWFVKSVNRWGNLGFELGFVPYPMADDYTGEYLSPVYGSSVSYLSNGHTDTKSRLAFNVWNALQIWETEYTPEEGFRISLEDKFNNELYIDAYMTVYDKTYVEFLNSIGIGSYSVNSLKRAINGGIPDGTYRTKIAEIVPTYETFLDSYLRVN